MVWRKARKGCRGQVKEKEAWWGEGEDGREGSRDLGSGERTDEEYSMRRSERRKGIRRRG